MCKNICILKYEFNFLSVCTPIEIYKFIIYICNENLFGNLLKYSLTYSYKSNHFAILKMFLRKYKTLFRNGNESLALLTRLY